MADGNITLYVTTQEAQEELARMLAENAALKLDLQYARDGLTKGRTRMREDNERLTAENAALKREAHSWSKAAETYATSEARLVEALRDLLTAHAMRASCQMGMVERCKCVPCATARARVALGA